MRLFCFPHFIFFDIQFINTCGRQSASLAVFGLKCTALLMHVCSL